jgi:hypothetical protein
MTRREAAHVQHGRAEDRGLSHLPLRKEPISDPTLIQHLDRARSKTGEVSIGAVPLSERLHDNERVGGRACYVRVTAPPLGQRFSALDFP